MSILASLAKAYDRLEEKPSYGYASRSIHGCIVLNSDGSLAGPPVLWHRDEKGKPSSRKMDVPYFGGRSGQRPPPYFLWDNTAYVLGVTAKTFDPSSRHEAFKKLHADALSRANDDDLVALRAFLDWWTPDAFERWGFPDEARDLNFVFRHIERKGFIHENRDAKAIWSRIYTGDSETNSVCLISGEHGPIARLHPPIGSFEKEARIVSFNEEAYCSYGHEKGDNAPVSELAAFKYTTLLNRFLSKDSRNRIQIGDASTVFWADASKAAIAVEAEDAFVAMFERVNENVEARKVGDTLERIRKGQPLDEVAPELSHGVRFYILGLAPNAARLSIRFWFDNDFGVLARNYQRFVADMRLDPPPRESNPPLWRYLVEMAVLGKRENVPPNLAGEWMRAILTGTAYPLTLLSTVLMRIRADGEVNALRIAILKALVIRNFKNEKEAPVSLDPENKNKGYLLGRLFAAYEHAQTAALGAKVNATIKDKFYGAASAQPRKIFSLLEKGSANHLSKVGKQTPGFRVVLEKAIGGIMEQMSPGDEPFPASLSADQQALFGLGYYHQRNEFFKSKKTELADQKDKE